MKTSKTLTKLSPALIKAQSEMGNAVKNSKNPFFKSTYSDLESVINAVKAPLNDNGLAVLQTVGTRKSGTQYIETVLLHSSGEWIRSRVNVIVAKERDPHSIGSGITYAKRFGLQALLLIPSADDDGNAASKPDTLTNCSKAMSMYDEIQMLVNKHNIDVKKILEWLKSDSKTIKGLNVIEQAKLLKELRKRR